ncbi:hypothetical protein HUW46_09298 [Amycolatopsis sp. CA-230715]|nr:hypothetical protein HUW46_09298 [Amycolatopsis sp. CA-230715]
MIAECSQLNNSDALLLRVASPVSANTDLLITGVEVGASKLTNASML